MAKRARKTSSLSPKKKQERKEAKAATEAQTAIVEAVVPFPSDEVKLKEEFLDIPLAIEADIDEAKLDLKEGPGSRKAEHNKRLRQLYKAMPVVTSFIVKIARMDPDDRSRAVRQIKHLIARLPIDDQPELPLYEPGSVAADEGSIFDKTGAGEAQAAERGDDPGKAGKRKSAEPPAARRTPARSPPTMPRPPSRKRRTRWCRSAGVRRSSSPRRTPRTTSSCATSARTRSPVPRAQEPTRFRKRGPRLA
jgi:hypothetical protein